MAAQVMLHNRANPATRQNRSCYKVEQVMLHGKANPATWQNRSCYMAEKTLLGSRADLPTVYCGAINVSRVYRAIAYRRAA